MPNRHKLETTAYTQALTDGYEWGLALQILDNATNQLHFFRWDWTRCTSEAPADLPTTIRENLNAQPGIDRVVLIGHSLGGLVIAEAAYSWPRELPLEAHVIASAPKWTGAGDRSLPPDISFLQSRTRQELGGAFKGLTRDPQVVDLPPRPGDSLASDFSGGAETLAGSSPPP